VSALTPTAPTTVPVEQSAPAVPYAPERRTEIERLRFAAEICGDFGIKAYSLENLPQRRRTGGAS
jgi:hypothetical protein